MDEEKSECDISNIPESLKDKFEDFGLIPSFSDAFISPLPVFL